MEKFQSRINPNGILKQHSLHVAIHFVVDAVIFAVAFVIGTDFVIPDDDLHMRLESYRPGILLGACIFPFLFRPSASTPHRATNSA